MNMLKSWERDKLQFRWKILNPTYITTEEMLTQRSY